MPRNAGAQWAHARKLAELTHPHVLPLLGISETFCRWFVYEAMPVRALLHNHGAILSQSPSRISLPAFNEHLGLFMYYQISKGGRCA